MTNFVIDWLRPTCIGTFNTRSERNLTGGAMAARWGLVLPCAVFLLLLAWAPQVWWH
jgi:hypothetical protein